MNRMDVAGWVLSACAHTLRLSQLKTLSVLVAAALHTPRISLANLGRAMLGRAKHQIKRAWRFCANPRVETADAMKAVIGKLLKRRKKRLLISFDWTDIRGFHTLMAAAVVKGRSIPLCWASCWGSTFDGHRSQNAFEESLLLVLRHMIPPTLKVTILADRGFGRTELARFCQQQGFSFILRVQPDVHVVGAGYRGKLLDYLVYKGIGRVLKGVEYRQERPVTVNVAIRWKRGLPKDRDECWFLITDLDLSAERLCQLYGRRMTIEELFRDGKNKRNGWSLRDTQLSRPERVDRLLLILALAYLLLCGLGLRARVLCRPGAWCSNNKQGTLSVFQIGLLMLGQLPVRPREAFEAVRRATLAAVPKWG